MCGVQLETEWVRQPECPSCSIFISSQEQPVAQTGFVTAAKCLAASQVWFWDSDSGLLAGATCSK